MAKKQPISSTQEYLDINEIREGVVILKDGGMRMVLLASSINFALKSEAEQNAIVGRYQGFLNAINFPVQIVIQSRKLDLEKYIEKLNLRLKAETNELIQLQINDYIEFIKRLITLANIMEKKFFVVISYTPPKVQARSWFEKIFHSNASSAPLISDQEFKKFKEELVQRANVVAGELGALGVKVIPLNTQQLIELYYSCYNLEEAETEKLTQIGEMSEEVIEKPVAPKAEIEKEEIKKQ